MSNKVGAAGKERRPLPVRAVQAFGAYLARKLPASMAARCTLLGSASSTEIRQFVRFLMVGVFNTAFGYSLIFACMYLLGLSPEASNIIGYSISLPTSYLLNRHYTFKSKRQHRGEITRFIAVFAIAYATNLVALVVLIRALRVHEGVSQILAGATYVLASYAMNKFYVFKHVDAA